VRAAGITFTAGDERVEGLALTPRRGHVICCNAVVSGIQAAVEDGVMGMSDQGWPRGISGKPR